MKKLFYDCEIANCIPSPYEDDDPNYKYCDGWHDFEGMGIAVIGVYLDWVDKYLSFQTHELAEFAAIANSADEIIGFNSISFDDNLLQANGINIKTTFDLLCQVRIAAGMPPHFVRGVTRGGYSLGAIATANLNYTKTGSGELAPKLWQDSKHQEVIDYCLNDVRLLVDLYGLKQLVDPVDGSIFKNSPDMKKTTKYSKACELLTFPHSSQEQLYSELNRLGWYWQPKKKEWERDNTPAKAATKLIRIRVWAAKEIVEDAAELFLEGAEGNGLRLIEKSSPYPCRPPNQLESRIYLAFEDIHKNEE